MDLEEQQALEEEQRDMMEEQMEAQAEALDYPRGKKQDSLFTLFKQVLNADDSSKVANLDPKFELGLLPISVRESQRIALLAKLLHHDLFAQFFYAQAEIILATSASKRGWFTELFVSQKRFTQRASSMSTKQAGGKKGWKIFGGGGRPPQQEAP